MDTIIIRRTFLIHELAIMAHPDLTINGVHIPYYEMRADLFLCKNTLIIGGSGTGKSSFARNILSVLAYSGKVPVGVLINGGDSRDLSPFFIQGLVKDSFDPDFITKFKQWQHDRIQIYRASTDLENLEQFVKKYMAGHRVTVDISAIDARYSEVASNQRVRDADKERAKTTADEIKVAIFRAAISKLSIDTRNMDENDLTIWTGAQLNPNIIMVFDDVGSELAKLPTICRDFLKFIYAKARHEKYTTLMLLQADTQLDKQNRSNAHMILWCDQATMQASTDPKRAIFSSNVARQAQQIANSNFFVRTPGEKYRVLGFDSKKLQFFYVLSEQCSSVCLASPAVLELSQRVSERERKKTGETNPLIKSLTR